MHAEGDLLDRSPASRAEADIIAASEQGKASSAAAPMAEQELGPPGETDKMERSRRLTATRCEGEKVIMSPFSQ